jgi:hypothetical protein
MSSLAKGKKSRKRTRGPLKKEVNKNILKIKRRLNLFVKKKKLVEYRTDKTIVLVLAKPQGSPSNSLN